MTDTSEALLLKDVTKFFTVRQRHPGNPFSAPTKVVGINNVSLRIGRGEVVGLIGGNGSGKTTLLKIMSGALTPTTGKVMASVRPRLVSLNGLQLPNLSVLENTELMLRAHGRSRKEARAEAFDLISLAELTHKTYLPYNTLSTGMRARLGFFLASINQPEVLLMDEMLSVADARFHERASGIVASMISRADSVVIASHSMETIQEHCQRAFLLDRGSIVLEGPAGEVVAKYIEQLRDPVY
jgi:ABC-type polysaccharide/polyol phosphate transport system ATPase subunit